MEIVGKLELGRRGAGGFNEDVSEDLKDMSYAEKAILKSDVLGALANLTVAVETTASDGTKNIGPAIVLDRSDIPEYDGKYFAGSANKVNQVFVHLKTPYLANSYTLKGKSERIKIIKTGEKFDVNLYNAEGSDKVKPRERTVTVVENGVEVMKKEIFTPSSYNEPTDGMKARIDKWLAENVDELGEIFEKLGLAEVQ